MAFGVAAGLALVGLALAVTVLRPQAAAQPEAVAAAPRREADPAYADAA